MLIEEYFVPVGTPSAYHSRHIYELVPATVEGYYLRRYVDSPLSAYTDDPECEWFVSVITDGKFREGWFRTYASDGINQEEGTFTDHYDQNATDKIVIKTPEGWKQQVCQFTGNEEKHQAMLKRAKDDKKARAEKKVMRFNFSDKSFKEVR